MSVSSVRKCQRSQVRIGRKTQKPVDIIFAKHFHCVVCNVAAVPTLLEHDVRVHWTVLDQIVKLLHPHFTVCVAIH